MMVLKLLMALLRDLQDCNVLVLLEDAVQQMTDYQLKHSGQSCIDRRLNMCAGSLLEYCHSLISSTQLDTTTYCQ